MRGGNQLAALTECRETLESDEFQNAREFVTATLPGLLEDPQIRRKLEGPYFPAELRPAGNAANFFESMGTLVRFNIVDRRIALGIVVRRCVGVLESVASCYAPSQDYRSRRLGELRVSCGALARLHGSPSHVVSRRRAAHASRGIRCVMSPEWLTAIATAGTFLVIAGSALAALFQLRHMRGGNQIAIISELRETMESAEFTEARRALQILPQRFRGDPELRKRVMAEPSLSTIEELRPAVFIGNYFESAGALVRQGIVDADLFCTMWAAVVIGSWKPMEQMIANRRLVVGTALLENFEYLAVLSDRWAAKNRHGTFPRGMERTALPALWPEAAEYPKP